MTQKIFIVGTAAKRTTRRKPPCNHPVPSWLAVIDLITGTRDANALKESAQGPSTHGSDHSCVPIDQLIACAVTERCSCASRMGYCLDKFVLAHRRGEAT